MGNEADRRATRRIQIAPSILAADLAALGQAVREAEAAGADAIHVDVMDGRFVPEISFGRQMVAALRRHTSLPMDVHLMVAEPQRHVGPFAESGASAITIHAEAFAGTVPLRGALESIRAHGIPAGVALKPVTPVDVLDDLWDAVDRVLTMAVEPGYSGQAFMPEVLPKLAALARRVRDAGRPVDLAVDGGIDEETARNCVEAGATFLVAGSSVYNTRRTVAEGMAALRAAVSRQ
ncbi:MAG: ribulose-phosphate 3-epimerase [Chloroflexi bacterium]|nr:ribulose-phosphate 3-epimerase [Chloroflexota bacterium]